MKAYCKYYICLEKLAVINNGNMLRGGVYNNGVSSAWPRGDSNDEKPAQQVFDGNTGNRLVGYQQVSGFGVEVISSWHLSLRA